MSKTIKQFLCFHEWPRYFSASGARAVDGINRHHQYIHRDCLKCGKRQHAMFHIPSEYVSALDIVTALKS